MSVPSRRDNPSRQRPARREHIPDLSFRVIAPPPEDLDQPPPAAESWPAWTDRKVSIADVDPADWADWTDSVHFGLTGGDA